MQNKKNPLYKKSRSFTSQTILPKSNIIKQLFSTTMPTHLLTSAIPYNPRLYNPLQHQLDIWSYSRLHQYCPLYPGISSNDSTSAISQDNKYSVLSSSPSNTSATVLDSNTMLFLAPNITLKQICTK